MTRDETKTPAELIDEVERLRNQLKTAEDERYHRLVDDLPQIVFETDINGRFTYANAFAGDAFGYSSQDVRSGLLVDEILHPDSRKTAQENTIAVLRGKPTPGQEYLGLRKDGSTFPMRVYSRAILKDGVPVGLRGIVIDITDIKEAQTALLASKNYYHAMFDNTGTAMITYGEDCMITSCNSQFASLCGYSPEDIEGRKRWSDFVVAEELGPLLHNHALRLIHEEELPQEYELTFKNKKGQRRIVHVSVKTIPGTEERVASITDITDRKQVEQALRKSEERYQLVVRGANDGIWDWNLATDSVYYSPQYKALLGYEDKEFPNELDSWKNSVHPDDLETVMLANIACIKGAQDHFRVEYRLRHKDGSYRWILGRGAGAKDENGVVYRLAGTHTDVTERQEAESRYRDIFEQASDGIYQCTLEGRMLTANSAMAHAFGYDTPEEFIETITDIENQLWVNPSERVAFLKNLRLTGSLQNYEEHLYRKDGSRFWISESVRAVYDDKGEFSYYEGFVQDITARKLHEKTTRALYTISKAISTTRDLQELYETIHDVLDLGIDATNFFIAMIDRQNDCLVFPYFADEVDEYYDIRNISDPEAKGLTLQVLRTGKPLFLSQTNADYQDILNTTGLVGTPPAVWLGVPLVIRGKSIGVMAVQHYSNPLHYTDQDVTFMETVSDQVALAIERKSNEDALTRLNEKLEAMVDQRTAELQIKTAELEAANKRLTELDKIKSSLVSSVSHELRTPLTSVRGFAKLAGRDFIKYFENIQNDDTLKKKGERILQNLGIIETEGERLTRLINDFLDINRIESGKATWHDRFLNPCEIVHKAVNAVKGGLTAKPEVELVIDLPDAIAPIHADPDKVQQILINLLNNACKFTDIGSITVSATSTGNVMTISVTDTGTGIKADEQPHVFEKFHKTSGDTVTVENKGTGLGLSICKEIVEHYGGAIWVKSTYGKGSVFSFTLPCIAGSKTACS